MQKFTTLALLCLIAPPVTMAAENSPPIKAAKCTFTDSTNQFFDDAALTWKVERNKKEVMEMTFDQLDSKSGQGRVIANNGAGDITIVPGDYNLTLIEFTGVGNVNMTSIHLGNAFTHGDKVQAAHSRHVGGAPALLPSQRVGACVVYLY